MSDWKCKKEEAERLLFPPKYSEAEEAKEAVLLVVRRDPRQFGYDRSRWQLQMIIETCDWLQLDTAAGLSRLLKRLGISYKRGRDYVHSPDPNYRAKLDLIELARLRAKYDPERIVLVYVDQLSYYRQPTLARAFEAQGADQPLACRSYSRNHYFRLMGALNCVTGQLTYRQQSRLSRFALADFWAQLHIAYPDAELIYAVVDNWPVHFHPDTLACLRPQQFPFPPRLPDNWSTEPTARAKHDNLPIQMLCLPTYASWLNPIEKLWRWLKQDVIHLHRQSDDWPGLRANVATFLDQFAGHSPQLLRYVGLSPI